MRKESIRVTKIIVGSNNDGGASNSRGGKGKGKNRKSEKDGPSKVSGILPACATYRPPSSIFHHSTFAIAWKPQKKRKSPESSISSVGRETDDIAEKLSPEAMLAAMLRNDDNPTQSAWAANDDAYYQSTGLGEKDLLCTNYQLCPRCFDL